MLTLHQARVAALLALLVGLVCVGLVAPTLAQTVTPTPAPLYSHDFEDGVGSGITFTSADAHVIEVDNARVLSLNGNQPDGSSAVIQGGEAWTDYAVDMRLQLATVDTFNQLADFALVLRADAPVENYVAVFMSAALDRIIIATVVENTIVSTHGITHPVEPGVWLNLRVAVEDSTLALFMDGVPIVETTIDSPRSGGSAGLLTFLRTGVYIDTLRVMDLSGDSLTVDQLPTPTYWVRATEASPLDGPTPTADVCGVSLVMTMTQTATVEPPESTTATPMLAPDTRVVVVPPGAAAAQVIVASANVRSGPGVGSAILGQVFACDLLPALAQATVTGQRWYLVEVAADEQAWIWGEAVRLIPSDATLPPP